ncbi:hypothetical protein RCI39_001052 [Enterobacter hormaechei]|nr:hypothetical protein [Enterobacter hormaechei]HEM8728263.1 hypothetical protein [Enterobacter hormaechei]
MNLQDVLNKLSPKKHPFEINGVSFFIHRARTKDIELLNQPIECVTVCTCDENGDPIFSTEDIDGRVNLKVLDSEFVSKTYLAIMELYKDVDVADEIEKK